MIGNSHQPRQQSYEDADEIQAASTSFSFTTYHFLSFLKFLNL